MPFANPVMLGGMAAGAAPIIIHLLSRQRYRRVVWAAMHWLLEAYKKSSRRLRIEQLILLAIRVLILVLLALAFAQPQFAQGGGLFGGGASLHRVIVLDTSASMGWRDKGRPTLFTRAKETAARLRANMRSGDALSLIACAQAPRAVLKGSTQPRGEEVARDFASIELADGATDMVAALKEAWDLATDSEVSRNPRREIFILTDGTRNGWVDPVSGELRNPDAVEAIRKAAAESDGPVPAVYVVDMAGSGREAWPERLDGNVAVEHLRPETPVLVTGASVSLDARVRNWDRPHLEGVPVTLWVDGEKQATKRSEPIERLGGEALVSFSHVFEEPGSHRVRVTCGDDRLAADNARYLAVEVRDRVRVLLVDGDPRPGPLESETDPLMFLFAPRRDETPPEFPIRPQVFPEGEFCGGGPAAGSAELEPYALIVLANVASVPEERIAALESYVRDGGGLLVYMGDRVDAALYNRHLYKDGLGLLPAALTEPVGDADPEKGGAVHFEPESYNHPILRLFRDPRNQNELPRTRIWRYMGTETGPADAQVRTILKYSDGAAAILERPFGGSGSDGGGGGRVCLVTTTADDDWTDFSWRAGVLMTYDLFYHLMKQPGVGMNLTVGQSIRDRLHGTEFGRAVTIHTPPSGDPPVEGRETLQAKEEGGRPIVTFEKTDRAGFYRLEIGRGEEVRRRCFAENLDPVESDLARLARTRTRDELAELLPGLPLQRVGAGEHQIEEALSLQTSRREFWRWFVWAVLALLCLESFLAWFWGRYR